MQKRPVFTKLLARIEEPRKFIQVLLGPRQVGKTTLATQLLEVTSKPSHYISADLSTLQSISWLEQEWNTARQKVDPLKGCLLIIDEIQKIPSWSEMVKSLWDQDTRNQVNLTVVLLVSSPWLMQKGLTESLAGRFEILPITHWSFGEMKNAFGYSLPEYLYFGGYPGAASLIHDKDPSRWVNYISESLIETTISRDILLMSHINKPALLRRLFQLGCQYSGQIRSYSKMLGELHEARNTTTLAHYLDLLAGAGLLCGLQKFSKEAVRKRGSSPKFSVLNVALMTAQGGKSFEEAKKDPVYWGRIVESSVGAYLLNSIRGTQIEVFYWREGDKEVDFVLQKGDSLVALEVKSNNGSLHSSGMDLFKQKFKPSRILLVGNQGIPLETFLLTPIEDLFRV